MTSNLSLIEQYLNSLTFSQSEMNSPHTYVRLFPALLGSSGSRIKLLSSFNSTSHRGINNDSASDAPHSAFSEKDLETNPYFKKYANKIKKLRISDPVEYHKRMNSLMSMHTQQTNEVKGEKVDRTKANGSSDIRHEGMTHNKQAEKGLDSILNIEKVKNLSSDQIQDLWVAHYANKDAVCAVISSDLYKVIQSIASTYPVFVYPIPRQDGYEMFVGQFSNDQFHFTSLVNYQRHQENAPSHLSLKHYTELQEEKGIVLMSGLVLDDAISVTDAQLLSYQIQHFFNEHSKLIRDFNKSPNTFNVNDVINSLDGALLSKANAAKK